jgi:uncharacterized membrane protein YkoI
MQRTRKMIIVAAATIALAAAGAGTAIAVAGGDGGDDGDRQATGAGADRARAAALAITGGTANAVERDGEDGATWEVEVTKPDGETADVRLDDRFRLVVVEPDGEGDDSEERE